MRLTSLVAVMFSVGSSRYMLPAQFLFLLVNAVSVLFAVIYKASTPDLYENNSHHPMGWAITWIAVAWVVIGVLNVYTSRSRATDHRVPVSAANLTRYNRVPEPSPYEETRWSGDSGQGTERNSSSLLGGDTRSPSIDSESPPFDLSRRASLRRAETDDDGLVEAEKRSFLRDTYVDKVLSRNISRIAAFRKSLTLMRIVYTAVERTLLILGFVAIASGGVVYAGIFVSGGLCTPD